jgi:glutamate 5-kinase
MTQQTSEELRRRCVCSAGRIVVKVGTNVLAEPGKPLSRERVGSLSEQIARLVKDGRQVALVTSGAIGSGMARLGMTRRPTLLPDLQAAASVGQGQLMAVYGECFARYGLHAGQILLTREDFDSRDRYLNASNTMRALFGMKCVPVVNENDTVSTDEIRFGDNDLLAALVTHLVQADLLVLLTSAPGLCARDPLPKAVRCIHEGLKWGARKLHVLDVVDRVDADVEALASDERSPGGLGGMKSKLAAVRIATESGEAAVIADGACENILLKLMAGERVGTLFLPSPNRMRSRKRWLRFTSRPRGALVVDEGAKRALQSGGKSLLPRGVTAVEGDFKAGDVVRIKGPDGVEFARGLTNYASDEALLIKGLRTSDIEAVLGYKYYDEVVHRDNMALL